MNRYISYNFSKIRLWWATIPLLLIFSLIAFLYFNNSFSALGYVSVQENLFLKINHLLSQLPDFQYNITQVGNALIFLSLLSFLFLKTPKLWEGLFSASLFSLIFSVVLKELIDVPRPAQILDNQLFTIIGEKAIGYSSLPSGHSITTFTTLSVLGLAFLSNSLKKSVLWIFGICCIGIIIAFSRVGVGAHHPLDVIFGSLIGCICGILGSWFCQKFTIWNWISNPKFYPFFILLFLGCLVAIIIKIKDENLVIFYFPLLSLLYSIIVILKSYVRFFKK